MKLAAYFRVSDDVTDNALTDGRPFTSSSHLAVWGWGGPQHGRRPGASRSSTTTDKRRGDDLAGQFLMKDTIAHLDTSAVQVIKGGRTAAYTLLLSDTGEYCVGAGDMEIHEQISKNLVEQHKLALMSSDLVVIDGNIPSETIQYILNQCHAAQVPVWFEPTDIHKAAKPFMSENWKRIKFTSPNFNELRMMCAAAGMKQLPPISSDLPSEGIVDEAKTMALFLAQTISTVVSTLGHLGVIVCRKESADQPIYLLNTDGYSGRISSSASSSPQARYYPAPHCEPVSVSGAGDCWNSGFISAALQGASETTCVKAGFSTALCSLAVTSAVPLELKTEII